MNLTAGAHQPCATRARVLQPLVGVHAAGRAYRLCLHVEIFKILLDRYQHKECFRDGSW